MRNPAEHCDLSAEPEKDQDCQKYTILPLLLQSAVGGYHETEA